MTTPSIHVSFLSHFLVATDEFFVKYYFEAYPDFSSKSNSFGPSSVTSTSNVVSVLYVAGMY